MRPISTEDKLYHDTPLKVADCNRRNKKDQQSQGTFYQIKNKKSQGTDKAGNQ